MQVPVVDKNGKQVKTVDLPEFIFGQEVNVGLMHQAFVRQMANARLGTHETLTRAEVSYTGKKMYAQKGTGNARHGDRGAPIFKGGGIAQGPQPRDYSLGMPRKMRRKAIRCALSALVRDQQVVFMDKFDLSAPKTKEAQQVLTAVAGSERVLVVVANKSEANLNVTRSVHNLPKAHVILANYLNIRDLLKYDKVVIPLDALEVIQGIWGQEG